MGMEFQSRAFVYLQSDDELVNDPMKFHLNWTFTGSRARFAHFCADAKSHSFDAARQVAAFSASLSNSIGFFSISADRYDSPKNLDRGYLLMNGFREINTRTNNLQESTPPALFNHYAFCRNIQLDIENVRPFLSSLNRYSGTSNQPTPIAGWYYHQTPVQGFDSVLSRFDDRQSVSLAQSVLWDDQYLFFGDISDPQSTVETFIDISSDDPTGIGLFFLISPNSLKQIAVFHGEAFSLGTIIPTDLEFHPDIKFETANDGYKLR